MKQIDREHVPFELHSCLDIAEKFCDWEQSDVADYIDKIDIKELKSFQGQITTEIIDHIYSFLKSTQNKIKIDKDLSRVSWGYFLVLVAIDAVQWRLERIEIGDDE